jgi:ribose 5-phosphate isomerase A
MLSSEDCRESIEMQSAEHKEIAICRQMDRPTGTRALQSAFGNRQSLPLFCAVMNPKQRAAEAALKYVKDGMVLGLGTGSTADEFLQALAAALKAGKIRNIRGVPTSRHSEQRSLQLGIPLTTLAECPSLDVTIDGADEVAPNLDLIKGLGGALLREKIVAQSSRKLVIIADSSKSVTKLGSKSMLPVEVVPFAHEVQERFLKSLESLPVLRRIASGEPFVTDNGNYIYDCRFPNGIDLPNQLEATLKSHAGIVETGLFLNIAAVALVADDQRTEERIR